MKRTDFVRARGFATTFAGGHCESSALANALVALGWAVTEADVAGGGGAPSFVYTGGAFPFLGGRSERMRETFLDAARIPYRAVVPGPGEDRWAGVFGLLDRGLPVPLRVDMRWLPYRYGGRPGPAHMAFGWHWICLFGADHRRGTAWVTDTGEAGPREIRLKDLEKARFSALKLWPPRGEYVALEPAPEGWILDRAEVLGAALAAVRDNYDGRSRWEGEGPLAGLAGLEALPEVLATFSARVKPWLRAPALTFLSRCIETNGTGGAAFRILFRDFLAGCSGAAPGLLAALDGAIGAWHRLAAELEAAGRNPGSGTGSALGACAEAAREVAAAEKQVRAALG